MSEACSSGSVLFLSAWCVADLLCPLPSLKERRCGEENVLVANKQCRAIAVSRVAVILSWFYPPGLTVSTADYIQCIQQQFCSVY